MADSIRRRRWRRVLASLQGVAVGGLCAWAVTFIPSHAWQIVVLLCIFVTASVRMLFLQRRLKKLRRDMEDHMRLVKAVLDLTPEELEDRFEDG